MKHLRIFISSPGDVQHERIIAKKVIRKIQDEFADSITLEPLLWEDLPLQANASFQEGIDTIVSKDGVDIAVFILGSRLGSPPGHKFCKPNGIPYLSGTEYEFDVMLEANRQSNGEKPSILSYIKSGNISMPKDVSGDISKVKEWLSQKESADKFIKEKFYDTETKQTYRAYHQFDVPTSFEQKLYEHIRKLVSEKVGKEYKKTWNKSPYVGLNSFCESEEPIFFGRQNEINEIEEKIIEKINSKTGVSLFVIGGSGSGKSSLIKAGILPDLMNSDFQSDIKCFSIAFTPSSIKESIYLYLIQRMEEIFPNVSDKSVWKSLKKGEITNYQFVSDLLQEGSEIVKKVPLLFIDQMEEFFTDPRIENKDRNRVFDLLNGLIKTNSIFFIGTLRNEFYSIFTTYNSLFELKENSIVFDIPTMGISQLQDIVEKPALKSGIIWERNKTGVSLNKTIIDEASQMTNALPLIEFTLTILYEKSPDNVITYQSYQDIGGVSGAIIHYANEIYRILNDEEKSILSKIFANLVTVSTTHGEVYSRKTILKKHLIKSEIERIVIDKMIKCHLFVSSIDSDGEATIAIVHEILIARWEVFNIWLEHEKELVKQNKFYEVQAQHWIDSNKTKEELIQSKANLKDVEYFLFKWGDNIQEPVKSYLLESIKKGIQRGIVWVYIATVFAALLLLFDIIAGFFYSDEITQFFKENEIEFSATDLKSVFPSFFILTVIMIYWLIRKIQAKPYFTTNRVSLIFWIIITFVASLEFIYSYFMTTEDFVYQLIYYGIVNGIIYLKLYQTVIFSRLIRSKWKLNQVVFKKRKENIVLTKILNTLGVLAFFGMAFSVLAYYGVTLIEKQEKIDATNNVLLELYDGLDRISDRLSATDIYYLNTNCIDLLIKNHPDEIHSDGTCQNAERLARSLYNTGQPYIAYEWYSGTNFLLRGKIYESLGDINRADTCLTLYWDEYKQSDFDQKIIWQLERCGNFELAKEVLDTIFSREIIDINTPSAFLMNFAHALLMTNRNIEAIDIYKKFKGKKLENGVQWDDALINDFAVLRWLGQNSEKFCFVEKELKLPVRPIIIQHDSTLVKKVEGIWKCEENGITIEFEIKNKYQLTHYLITDEDDFNWAYFTRYKLRKVDDEIVIEEFDFNSSILSRGKIHLVDNNTMLLTMINSGNSVETEKVRKYTKIE